VPRELRLGDIHSGDPRITAAPPYPFRLEEFRQYIPYGIIVKDVADVIERHIAGGVYRLDEGRLDGRVSQILHGARRQLQHHSPYGPALKRAGDFGPARSTFNNIKGELRSAARTSCAA
jgi:hypothetical protein